MKTTDFYTPSVTTTDADYERFRARIEVAKEIRRQLSQLELIVDGLAPGGFIHPIEVLNAAIEIVEPFTKEAPVMGEEKKDHVLPF